MIKTLTSAVEVCDREGHPDTPPIDSQRSSWKDADQMVQHLLDDDRAFRERRPSRLERLSHEMRLVLGGDAISSCADLSLRQVVALGANGLGI